MRGRGSSVAVGAVVVLFFVGNVLAGDMTVSVGTTEPSTDVMLSYTVQSNARAWTTGRNLGGSFDAVRNDGLPWIGNFAMEALTLRIAAGGGSLGSTMSLDFYAYRDYSYADNPNQPDKKTTYTTTAFPSSLNADDYVTFTLDHPVWIQGGGAPFNPELPEPGPPPGPPPDPDGKYVYGFNLIHPGGDDLSLYNALPDDPDVRWDIWDDTHSGPQISFHSPHTFWVQGFFPIPGDINLDGVVDTQDFSILKAYFGEGELPTWPTGDLNGDGVVDAQDFSILKAHFGQHTPEPATAVLLAAGAAAALWKRRRL